MAIELDDNLVQSGNDLSCRHCGTRVAPATGEFLAEALWREQPSVAAGRSVVRAEPELFVDRTIVLRQAFCPGCLTLLLTEVVPQDEPRLRSKAIHA